MFLMYFYRQVNFSKDLFFIVLFSIFFLWPPAAYLENNLALAQALNNPEESEGVTLYVDDDYPDSEDINGDNNYRHIQKAIEKASDGDIVIVQPGLYQETINLLGKAITIRSTNPDDPEVVTATVIDGDQKGCVVTFNNGEGSNTILSGLTIIHGKTERNAWRGGGIYCHESSPTINNCTITENLSESYGGGIYCYKSSSRVSHCLVGKNESGMNGNGIYLGSSSATIEDCTITENQEEGIYCSHATSTIRNCNITFNHGNGIVSNHSSDMVIDCNISHNNGFGVLCSWYSKTILKDCTIRNNNNSGFYCYQASPTLSGCDIFENLAEKGAGIRCSTDASLNLVNCSIHDNTASYGGGIYTYSQTSLCMKGCLIYQNTANTGGGLYSYLSVPVITNCIFYNNQAQNTGSAIFCEYASPYLINSILWNHDQSIYTGEEYVPKLSYCNIQGGYEGLGNINEEPLFVDPENGNFLLRPDSPCIDAGHPRIYDSDSSRSDIGAYGGESGYEEDNNITITVANDGSGDFSSIQDALDYAVSGDSIMVYPGIYHENLVMAGKDISLQSVSGADATIIDGSSEGPVLVIDNVGSDALLEGFTIQNGLGKFGGGVGCWYKANPTISDCIFINNASGGVYCYFASPKITNSIIKGNTGAGIYFWGDNPGAIMSNCQITENTESGINCMYTYDSSLTIIECIISDNSTGGIRFKVSSPIIINSAILRNSASSGGGIYCRDSHPKFMKCTIDNNTADRGGGILCSRSSPQFINCIITRNKLTGENKMGGGLYCEYGSTPSIIHCTIGDNYADLGGGLYYHNASRILTITNSILWNNGLNEIYSENAPLEVTYSDISGGYEGVGNIYADPLFVDPENGDYHLQSRSPCIDAGVFIDDPEIPIDTDKDGNPRPGFLNYDMGAFEFQDLPGYFIYYLDADGDGYGDNENPTIDKYCPSGYTEDNTDCDDSDPFSYPEAPEACDGEDNDCDGEIDEENAVGCTIYYKDEDNDSYGLDIDTRCLCTPEGFYKITFGGDCDDTKGFMNPANQEIRDGYDNNCNGETDEAPLSEGVIYVDNDYPEGENNDNDNGFRHIQAAIEASKDGDVIIVHPGTYGETIDFKGKAITIKSIDPNDPDMVEATIIDADQKGAVVTFKHEEGSNSILCGLTVRNGRSKYDSGGIICGKSSSPTITKCHIEENSDVGIRCIYPSVPFISHCKITNNSGHGLMYYFSPPSTIDTSIIPLVSHSTISNNDSSGIISNYPSLIDIRHCLISNNNHIGIKGPFLSIVQSTIKDNKDYGIFTKDYPTPSVIEDCLITGNSKAGIYCKASSISLNNCTINANNGKALYCESASLTINNCIISDNMGIGLDITYNSLSNISNCTISGNKDLGVNYTHSSGSVTIDNCTITHNVGGIRCNSINNSINSSTTISNCRITENSDNESFGGIYVDGYTAPHIYNCTISGNTSSGKAGGIYCIGESQISNCTISNNSPCGIYSSRNASANITDCSITANERGIICSSSSTYRNCIISENTQGGIICSTESRAYIVDCNIYANSATEGGGILSRGKTHIIQSNVHDNSADYGGGIYCADSTILTRCLIYKNMAKQGAGMYCKICSPLITNCVFYENTATNKGGGIFSRFSTPSIVNSIFWKNGTEIYIGELKDYRDYEFEVGSLTKLEDNFMPQLSYCNIQGGYSGLGNIDEDPLFVDPENSDFHLQPGSLCIDAGQPRIYDNDDSRSDIGAYGGGKGYETTNITIIVKKDESGNYTSLQDAIDYAINGDSIVVYPGTYSENIAIIGKEITLKSTGGAENTIIDGSEIGPVVVIDNVGSNSILEGLTLENGADSIMAFGCILPMTLEPSKYGAGLCCRDGSAAHINKCIIRNNKGVGVKVETNASPTISNCIIKENSDHGLICWGSGDSPPKYISYCTIEENTGRGISLHYTHVTKINITNCDIKGNSNGGIYCYKSSPTIMQSTITSNSNEQGGGIYCWRSSPKITNCTIRENSAHDGSGIYLNSASKAVLTNCAIIKNININVPEGENTYGGGMYCLFGSNCRIINCTISDNEAHYGGGIYANNSFPEVINSILWNPLSDEIYLEDATLTITYSNIKGGYEGQGNIDFDPHFIDPAEGNYHLQTDSPCIDKGIEDGAPDVDKDRNTRPQGAGYDMGAYEFYATEDTISIDIGVYNGWNMISLPVSLENRSVSVAFPEAIIVYGCEKGVGYFQVDGDEELNVGHGYWILMPEEQTYTLHGKPIRKYSLSVTNGWFMIGGCSYPASAFINTGSIQVIYKYETGVGYQRVSEADDMEPGQGYWILLKDIPDQGELVVSLRN